MVTVANRSLRDSAASPTLSRFGIQLVSSLVLVANQAWSNPELGVRNVWIPWVFGRKANSNLSPCI